LVFHCLAAVPERGRRFFAVPVKVRAGGTFPVRAFAIAEAGGSGASVSRPTVRMGWSASSSACV